MRTGDMVLVHITAFKGRHKIQNRWENKEYVVEWQPYPNLPVYVAHPMMGRGAAGPCLGIISYPSIITWSRQKMKIWWRELSLLMSPLQCHKHIMSY